MAKLDDTAKVVANVADEAIQVVEASRRLAPKDIRLLLIGLGIGLAGGAVVGGIVVNNRVRTKYELFAENEINNMREFFRSRMVVREDKPDLDVAAAQYKYETIVDNEKYTSPTISKTEEVEDNTTLKQGHTPDQEICDESEELYEDPSFADNVKNFFQDEDVHYVFIPDPERSPDEGWDYDVEMANRTSLKPYVIHVDERGESVHSESCLTYYEGDDVLTAEDDTIIDDKDMIVGIENLEKFGHGSGDENVVFIRNDALGVQLEVTKNEGYYSEVVHGFKHSEQPMKRHRQRYDDDPDLS